MAKPGPKGVKKAAKELAEKLGKERGKEQDPLAKKVLEKGFKPKDVLGMNDTMVEGIYGQAYRLYNTGKYKDAIQLFRLLIMLNATEPKYAMGLAACFHMLKEYENAIGSYGICAAIDPTNPIPHYHASDCYLKMNDKRSALIALELASSRIGEKPEYQGIKDRVEGSIASLKKEIDQENKKK